MAKKSTLRMDLTGLQVMATGLKKLADGKYRVQVGLFGDKAVRRDTAATGVTNAEVGFVQEMGSVERHIPRRSFLVDTFSFHGALLAPELAPAMAEFFKKGKVDQYLKVVAEACKNLVKEAFFTSGWGAWAPNAYSTLLAKLKGPLARRRQMAAEVLFEGATHAKPLIRSGQLWQAVDARAVRS